MSFSVASSAEAFLLIFLQLDKGELSQIYKKNTNEAHGQNWQILDCFNKHTANTSRYT